MIIITDILKEPLDEGGKVAVYNLLQAFKKRYYCTILSINSDDNLTLIDINFDTNKFLATKRLYDHIKRNPYKSILYIPSASITLNTFVRAKLLSTFTRKSVNILSLQPRNYSKLVKSIISMMCPHSVITQSFISARQLDVLSINTKILPLGVDYNKFNECDKTTKSRLRQKYSLDTNKKILLHVGHIKKERNLEWLAEVKKNIRNIKIVVVGSINSVQDKRLRNLLTKKGIFVLREYIPLIEELYQLADYYIFPVLKNDAAIETPLSVLEAMATNLSILTTPFGSLPETFQEDKHFRFINSPADAVTELEKGFPANCNNRKKIWPFTWDAIAEKLHEMI